MSRRGKERSGASSARASSKARKPKHRLESIPLQQLSQEPVAKSSLSHAAPTVVQPGARTIPYDETLLERAHTQWQCGDWESLAKLDRILIQHHPDRAKLAILAAAGHQQQGDVDAARSFTRLALNWGCSKSLISRVLIAGVYNTLGRAAAVAEETSHRSLDHFTAAIATGMPNGDIDLITEVRARRQLAQMGIGSSGQPRQWIVQRHFDRKKVLAEPSSHLGAQEGGASSEVKIKVFGALRSGTNYLRTLLEWNCNAKVIYSEVGGWKHGPISDYSAEELRARGIYTVCMIKNPWSSLVSWFHYLSSFGFSMRAAKSWPEFIRSRFVVFDSGKKTAAAEYRFANPVEYWNASVWNLVQFVDKHPRRAAWVRYEDILINPQGTLVYLAKRFQLTPNSSTADFLNPANSVRRMGDGLRDKADDYVSSEVFDKEFYLEKVYLKRFSGDDLDFVAKNLDSELLFRLEY